MVFHFYIAVATNDVGKAERWLKSWARVNTKKGDRRLIDVARALNRKEIVRLLEEYEHINEFVCATFACDLKQMMNLLALGRGFAQQHSNKNIFLCVELLQELSSIRTLTVKTFKIVVVLSRSTQGKHH